ncbi:hypothetical protein IKD67_03590 [Candidatus Saccharibacteria bacterium]|nr:hypothetical protein [Candidatus Saccharibacteria bacterium]
MDPANNPTPTPNPEPTPAPEPPVAPAADSAPTPAESAAPVEPNPAPVNPVINPGANPEPVNPVFQPGDQGGFAATDPIMQPEAPKAPDPVEEELKAPMEPAGPAPGSIGSAVSGPTDAPAETPAENPFAAPKEQTPNVSFTDPATQPENAPAMGVAKPKANKGTLIALIAVAAIVVVVLIVVLVMSLMPQGNNSSSQSNNTTNNVVEPDKEEEEEDETPAVTTGNLSCTRNMTPEELVGINDAASGAINISAEFDNDTLISVSRVDSVVYNDENASATEPVENEVHETKAADLNATSALNYFLSPNASGNFELTFDEVQANYEDLDFTCEVL